MTFRRCLPILFAMLLAGRVFANSSGSDWDEVDAALKKGLPRTAIERLKPIAAEALKANDYPRAVRAIALRVSLESGIEGSRPAQGIRLLEAEIVSAPAPMKPMLEAVLADWYWQYFQQDRWRFMERTRTDSPPGPDLASWDLPTILGAIDRHFSAALADESTLKATKISDWGELLKPGALSDAYRPTLYDFVAFQALEFYQAAEVGPIAPEDEFEIDATGPIFAPAADFMAWKPGTGDSPRLKAIALYQALLRFHESDSDRSAFLDADLARLNFGKGAAVGDSADEACASALLRFAEANATHEISARAFALLAQWSQEGGEMLKAHEFAERGRKTFPESPGGIISQNILTTIEAKSAQLKTEAIWNAPWPMIDVTYRNITKVYFRAIRMDFARFVPEANRYGRDQEQLEKVLAEKPALAWSADLPPTNDFAERTEHLPAPDSLKPGFYALVASHSPDFSPEGQISATTFWVSNLAIVFRNEERDLDPDGLVLDARTGAPVAGAEVLFWAQTQGKFRAINSTGTDRDGRFAAPTAGGELAIMARKGDQSVATLNHVYQGGREENEADTETVFFTDRAIYRPGQTINYKGVSVRYDTSASRYSAIAGLEVTVVFDDPNGKEIARASQRTNEFGSFSGVFTAPRDRLLGNMSIVVLGRPSRTYVRVEEYKRPKFEVVLEPPHAQSRLGATVTVPGKATAYTGAPIGGARVKWSVMREAHFPRWGWWWRPPPSKAIAHGTATTSSDGTFEVQFSAEPDRSIPEKNEPVFSYHLNADVTDATGESRAANRDVQVGYAALQASVLADDWQTTESPVEFSLGTASLDGEPLPARGRLTIHALQQPAMVARVPLAGGDYWPEGDWEEPRADPTNPDSWALGKIAAEQEFRTDATGMNKISVKLPAGIYRAELATEDMSGRKVTARATVQVVDPKASHFGIKLPFYFNTPTPKVEPGSKFTALWGTGYDSGRAFVELVCDGEVLQRYWTSPGRTQQMIDLPITEKMRGGVALRITSVRENRAYTTYSDIEVPWTDRELAVKWEHFHSKLTPGQEDTWTAVITGPDAKKATAEMVATLYDASLDQFAHLEWPEQFSVFRSQSGLGRSDFGNRQLELIVVKGWEQPVLREAELTYRSLLPGLALEWVGAGGRFLGDVGASSDQVIQLSPFSVDASSDAGYAANTLAGTRLRTELKDVGSGSSVVTKHDEPAVPDLAKVTARKNLGETAFFLPHLVSGADGVVRISFKVPEALTSWRFLGFAHDARLRAGLLTANAVTAKDLMVEPNPPRFLREGDEVEFTVKVTNRAAQAQSGSVRLQFADAESLQPADESLGNRAADKPFNIPAGQARTFSWRISVPDGTHFLIYKAVAASATNSDGEEGPLPVLSRRVLVTESLPLPIRGKTTRDFTVTKLLESARSDTLSNQSLTVEMTSQPAWYAVMALPYLMEFPHECSEQVFNRLYANALAAHLAKSDPKIRRVFDLWKNTKTLESPLEKNQDLKSVMLEETPWLQDAVEESRARKNVGLLFDANRLEQESARVLAQLSDRQLPDGMWSWFPGGPKSSFISLYIVAGFGRLQHLGVGIDPAPALKALDSLDEWMADRYREIARLPNPEKQVPDYLDVYYLYGRSFFLKEHPVSEAHRPAFDYFVRQARAKWVDVDCRQCQAYVALALQRIGDSETAQAVVKSLKERSITNEEMGRYWRDTESSWWWYDAPIETQAMMIEAFAEITNDAAAVEECKVWLLKQKQTQAWPTTKATADAAYALLLRGSNLLASDALVEVSLGGVPVKPDGVEAGTGYYEEKFVRGEIKPEMGRVTVRKSDEGISWGSVHWQYLEDVGKITPHEGTGLQLKKSLYVRATTGKGSVLRPVTGPVSVGDELVVRLELRNDRDMEFVHLKDARGSGTEPVNVLSQYEYQDGLFYYESTRDTASHFFIDYLPKGTHVFEYSVRVQLKGRYQTGLAEIQCMYAPEFNSHSESVELQVGADEAGNGKR